MKVCQKTILEPAAPLSSGLNVLSTALDDEELISVVCRNPHLPSSSQEGRFMKRLFAVTALTAVVATAVTPALAANSNLRERGYVHEEADRPIHRGFAADRGFAAKRAFAVDRGFAADPSFGNRAGINTAKQTGRCVEDLGYGRFEYCGW
jgi:hypothetical protein